MCKFSSDCKNKIGNTIVYIASNTKRLSKTKLLKLLYMMEVAMVSKYHVPFLAIPYEVWKWGPVQKDLYADLSDEIFLMKDYVLSYYSDKKKYFKAKRSFCDDEFSQAEITLMDDIIREYGKKNARQLEKILHEPGTLWYNTASRNNVLESFKDGTCNSTDIKIDFSELLSDASAQEEYNENLKLFRTANNLKAIANV